MTPEEELVERRVALDHAVQAAVDNGMSANGVRKLREVVERSINVFRRSLCGDSPTRLGSLRVRFDPGARAVKASLRVYSPRKTAWLAGCMATLVALGLVLRSLQAVWASAAMATPKKGGYRLVSDYLAVNKRIKKVPSVMPNHEEEMVDLLGPACFGKIDMLQGYWQMPLAADAQEIFNIANSRSSVYPHSGAARRAESYWVFSRHHDRTIGSMISCGGAKMRMICCVRWMRF